MQRKILILCLLMFFVIAVNAQDSETDFPDIIGKTVPEAEALLNSTIYRLDSMILVTDIGTNTEAINTVVDFEIIDDGTIVQVTVLREYNVELIWDNIDFFTGRSGLSDLSGNELFTFVNSSDIAIAFDNLQIANFDTSAWSASIPGGQCAQIWTTNETDPVVLPECSLIQVDNIANRLNFSDPFWINNDSFDIFQNGIYRGTCQVSDGRCQLWLSPLPIADDIAPYVYLIYDMNELVIYNSSDSQWMDLAHLRLNDEASQLSAVQNWDTIRYPDDDTFTERLAPGQCARFTNNVNPQAVEDCTAIITQDTAESDIFWREAFTIHDTLNGNENYTCPPASDERSVCLLGR